MQVPTTTIRIHCTEKEYDVLAARAKRDGLTIEDWVFKQALVVIYDELDKLESKLLRPGHSVLTRLDELLERTKNLRNK
jgi:hypothetical protein